MIKIRLILILKLQHILKILNQLSIKLMNLFNLQRRNKKNKIKFLKIHNKYSMNKLLIRKIVWKELLLCIFMEVDLSQ
jgi:hypothetical protein